MAIERNGHYRDYEPDDIRELREAMEAELGEEFPDPVWTIGRLDERGLARFAEDPNEAPTGSKSSLG